MRQPSFGPPPSSSGGESIYTLLSSHPPPPSAPRGLSSAPPYPSTTPFVQPPPSYPTYPPTTTSPSPQAAYDYTQSINYDHKPPPFVPSEDVRNTYMSSGAPSPPQEKRPFMQSLTSMHHGMSGPEVSHAERRRAEWLRDLEEQVKDKEQRRLSEKAAKEIEDLKEELQLENVRNSADAALRASFAAGKPRA